MNKNDIIRKLSSRKFWVCICGFVSSVLAMFRFGESEIALVTSIITSAGCLVAYILSEGYVDAAGISAASGSSGNASDTGEASDGMPVREWRYEECIPWEDAEAEEDGIKEGDGAV